MYWPSLQGCALQAENVAALIRQCAEAPTTDLKHEIETQLTSLCLDYATAAKLSNAPMVS